MQRARDYCKMARASQRFDSIFRLSAPNSPTAVRGFELLASRIALGRPFNDPEAIVAFVKERLARLAELLLKVSDKYDKPDDFPAIATYSPTSAAEAVQVMCRHRATERLGNVVSMTRMLEDEASALLLR
jgi:hypothetical protein